MSVRHRKSTKFCFDLCRFLGKGNRNLMANRIADSPQREVEETHKIAQLCQETKD